MADNSQAKAAYHARTQHAKNELTVAHPQIDKRLTPRQLERVGECRLSLERFCKLLLPEQFKLPWCDAHLEIIERCEAAVLRSESLAMALPRGSGKTAISRAACVWALLNGHSKFVVLVCASASKAKQELRAIKSVLRFSDRLAQHYPQLIVPLRALDGEPRKAAQQTYRGEHTQPVWGAESVTLPFMPGVPGSESTIEVTGIEGEIRGKSTTLRDGSVIRPDLCVIDDPQTAASAASASMTASRLQTILADCAFLSGPDSAVGLVCPMTVIRRGDVADTLLDKEKHPTFHGKRVPYFDAMPSNLELWEQYQQIRRKCLIDDKPIKAATDFYVANREELDAGCDVYWTDRFNKKLGEISSIQAGMHRWLDDPISFAAEYQNNPEATADKPPIPMLSEAAIQAKTNGLSAFVPPRDTAHLVTGIDVHGNVLYWSTLALEQDYTGSIVAYGTYPRQPSAMFRQANVPVTLQDLHPGSEESAIVAGLSALIDDLCGREYTSADGRVHHMSRVLIDSGYQPSSVAAVIQRSEHASILTMSKGLPLGPDSRPLSEYDTSRMLRWGPPDSIRWYVDKKLTHGQELLRYDKGFWVQTLHARLCTPVGDRSCLDLFGGLYTDHRNFAGHMHGLVPKEKYGRLRSTVVWEADRTRDDHFLDTVMLALIAASTMGCTLPGRPVPQAPKPYVSLKSVWKGK